MSVKLNKAVIRNWLRALTRVKALDGDSPEVGKKLHEIALYSFAVFILSALLIQLVNTLVTAMLLKFFSMHFRLSLFGISYEYFTLLNWSVSRIILVYSIGPVLCFIAGLLIMNLASKSWKDNLALTWLSFQLVCMLPAGMLAGVLIYDSFGFAFIWIFPGLLIRIALGVVAVGAMMLSAPYWTVRFLKASFSMSLIKNHGKAKRYIRYVVLLPWFAGVVIFSVFAIPKHAYYWYISLVTLGIILMPVYKVSISSMGLRLHKPTNEIFPFPYPKVIILSLVAVLWIVSLFSINL